MIKNIGRSLFSPLVFVLNDRMPQRRLRHYLQVHQNTTYHEIAQGLRSITINSTVTAALLCLLLITAVLYTCNREKARFTIKVKGTQFYCRGRGFRIIHGRSFLEFWTPKVPLLKKKKVIKTTPKKGHEHRGSFEARTLLRQGLFFVLRG